MSKLSYCTDCKRIDYYDGTCGYCQSENIKDLKTKAPVNVIGTKIKGKVVSVKGQIVHIICMGQGRSKQIREFEVKELRKIL